ncbi:MAG: diadenylate cyclase CdaA [Oscillospiraceae bacterium]|jgi:diadenylate cyclase|nr:diadenylate cyclase CdaA [Oscillospiraceae bacterium]
MSEVAVTISTFCERIWAIIVGFRINDLFDILFVALIIYGLIRLMRETRSVQLLKGLFGLVIAWGVVNLLDMSASKFIFTRVFDSFVLLLLVLFQPEIRSLFESIGRSNVSSLKIFSSKNRAVLDQEELADAIHQMVIAFATCSENRVGALVVFEQETMLGEVVKTGTVLEAKITRQLVCNLFFPNAPLHDGAVVVRNGYICAAGCILPLTQNTDIDPALGTRHRAAIGMSEQCDAIVCVVSEETGHISFAYKGVLHRNLLAEELEDTLRRFLLKEENAAHGNFLLKILRRGK